MKILIDAKHGLGDCVQLIPMLLIIKENYPDCYLCVLVRNISSESILRMAPMKIDKFFYYDSTCDNDKYLFELIIELRNIKFDYFILSPITTGWKAKIFAFLIGAKYSLGEQYKKYDLYQRDNSVHMVLRNIELLKSFCQISEDIPKPQLIPPENCCYNYIFKDDISVVGVCISKATPIIVNGVKIYPRSWESKKWGMVVDECLNKGFTVILLGGKEDLEELSSLNIELSRPNIINLVGKTSLEELSYIVNKCCCVLGVDTGTQHIADSVDTKTISIFGPTNPMTHGAYSKKASFVTTTEKLLCKCCFSTNQYGKCCNKLCLSTIHIESVISKL